jgi:hypothetical protein
MAFPKLRPVRTQRPEHVLVNAGETRSVVGSETDTIARALSLLHSVIGEHPGRLTYSQACDVVRWCEGGAA